MPSGEHQEIVHDAINSVAKEIRDGRLRFDPENPKSVLDLEEQAMRAIQNEIQNANRNRTRSDRLQIRQTLSEESIETLLNAVLSRNPDSARNILERPGGFEKICLIMNQNLSSSSLKSLRRAVEKSLSE